MASLIEAIDIKRKMFFEFEDAPYHCLDRDVSTPTARGGQTLVRLKMRNLITGAVFDKTFKAGDKFKEPDLVSVPATFLYADGTGYHFMDQESFDTLTLRRRRVGDGATCSSTTCSSTSRSTTATRSALEFPPHVELTVTSTEPGVRGDTASGGVTKVGDARDRAGDPRAALHQGGREGEGAHGNAGVCGKSLANPTPNPKEVPTLPNRLERSLWTLGVGLGFEECPERLFGSWEWSWIEMSNAP